MAATYQHFRRVSRENDNSFSRGFDSHELASPRNTERKLLGLLSVPLRVTAREKFSGYAFVPRAESHGAKKRRRASSSPAGCDSVVGRREE